VSIKESLEKEIHNFRDDMTARFDAQATRLERQGGMMRAANVWLSRMTDWSEKIDSQLGQKTSKSQTSLAGSKTSKEGREVIQTGSNVRRSTGITVLSFTHPSKSPRISVERIPLI
jgi:hypothetical protein